MRDWLAIRKEYVGGGISLRDLARKHGVCSSYVLRRAAKEGWSGQRRPSVSVKRVDTLSDTPKHDTPRRQASKQVGERRVSFEDLDAEDGVT